MFPVLLFKATFANYFNVFLTVCSGAQGLSFLEDADGRELCAIPSLCVLAAVHLGAMFGTHCFQTTFPAASCSLLKLIFFKTSLTVAFLFSSVKKMGWTCEIVNFKNSDTVWFMNPRSPLYRLPLLARGGGKPTGLQSLSTSLALQGLVYPASWSKVCSAQCPLLLGCTDRFWGAGSFLSSSLSSWLKLHQHLTFTIHAPPHAVGHCPAWPSLSWDWTFCVTLTSLSLSHSLMNFGDGRDTSPGVTWPRCWVCSYTASGPACWLAPTWAALSNLGKGERQFLLFLGWAGCTGYSGASGSTQARSNCQQYLGQPRTWAWTLTLLLRAALRGREGGWWRDQPSGLLLTWHKHVFKSSVWLAGYTLSRHFAASLSGECESNAKRGRCCLPRPLCTQCFCWGKKKRMESCKQNKGASS